MARPSLEALRAALHDAGIPNEFSVVPVEQRVPRSLMREIDAFIGVFDRVTTRPRWQQVMTADAPAYARQPHTEVCFFSAWDVHVPDDDRERWQLIEVNDNGSGYLFAATINRAYYQLADLGSEVEPPPSDAASADRIAAMIDREARAFFGDRPDGVLLILDDAASLAHGHFRVEHELLAALLTSRGWAVAVGAPEELAVTNHTLHHRGRPVRFVVNRSTDFLWTADAFAPLRACFAARTVYVAPNPFTYLTRSDKCLLEWLSCPDRDDELGIEPDERAILSAHVPETRLVRSTNLDALADRKHELFFKPAHGFASHGTIASAELGRSRLRRLLRDRELYVAQRFVAPGRLQLADATLYADLRVWAYRGAHYLVSGRASTSQTRRDLRSGGWIPTFVGAEAAHPR